MNFELSTIEYFPATGESTVWVIVFEAYNIFSGGAFDQVIDLEYFYRISSRRIIYCVTWFVT